MPIDWEALKQAVIEGDNVTSREITEEFLEGGDVDPLLPFRAALIPAMDVVGVKMQNEEYYIPEVLLSARAMRASSDLLKPLIAKSDVIKPVGKVVSGTVKGDLHDIGKNLLNMMLEGAGFKIFDQGPNTPVEKFIKAIKDNDADILCMSAMLTTTMINMKEVIEACKAEGIRDKICILVGGAPINQKFADDIGADGYGDDAAIGVQLAKQHMASKGVPVEV